MHLFWHSNLLTLARPTAGEERRRHEAAGCVFPHSLPYFPFGPRFTFVGSLLSGSAAAASLLHSTVNGRTMDFLSCKKNAMKLKKHLFAPADLPTFLLKSPNHCYLTFIIPRLLQLALMKWVIFFNQTCIYLLEVQYSHKVFILVVNPNCIEIVFNVS